MLCRGNLPAAYQGQRDLEDIESGSEWERERKRGYSSPSRGNYSHKESRNPFAKKKGKLLPRNASFASYSLTCMVPSLQSISGMIKVQPK